jgi:hypothetical protein
MRTTVRTRRGYALVSVMLLTGIFLTMALAMIGMASTSRRLAIRRSVSAQALNLAMGAADDAVLSLKTTPSFTGYGNRSLGPGSVSVSVAEVSGIQRIVSTATVSQSGFSATRSVRVSVQPESMPIVFTQLIASNTDLSVTGSTKFLSLPQTGRAHIHSNATLRVGGSVVVDGDATATGPLVRVNGNPTVTGSSVSGVPPVQFPPVTDEFKNQALANGSVTGNVTVGNGSLVQGKINGGLTVNNPNGARVTGVVHVTGSVTINGPVSGKGTIVADGPITVNFTGTYPLLAETRVVYISTQRTGTAISLGGNRQFRGTVYSPYANIHFNGSSNFTMEGALLGHSLTFSGSTTITRDTNFESDPPPIPDAFAVKGWEEL